MKIAVVSDIHDNIWNLERALARIEEEGAVHLFFLGDLCAPFTLAQLADRFPHPIDVVFGNNDGDTFLIAQVAAKYPHVTLHGQYAEVTVNDKRVGLTHYPEIATALADGDRFEAVFFGHNHTPSSERVGSTLLANPGEVMGRFDHPTFGVWDTERGTFTHVDIPR